MIAILIVLAVLMLLGVIPTCRTVAHGLRPKRRTVGLVLLIVVILLLTGRI